MAASFLQDRDVLILEHNPYPAAKIKISGGGRCNISNRYLGLENYLADPRFIEKVFKRFDNESLLHFLNKRGLEPVLRENGCYFCKKSGLELVELLLNETKKIPVEYGIEVEGLEKEGGCFAVRSSAGSFFARKVIVATGGLSYPSLGASSIGFKIAESFGHSIIKPRPALVGFTLQPEQFWMKELSGISTPVEISVGRRRFASDILFTHRGISGPSILDASLFWNRGKITIDFLPGIKLKNVFLSSRKSAASQIPLPKRFIKTFFKTLDLPDTPYKKMDERDKQCLSCIKSYSFSPAGTFGYDRAEVTKGGISTSEIDPETMQSRLIEGLFFAGEVVDVTGLVGGYNFQWTFSSAVVAAKSV